MATAEIQFPDRTKGIITADTQEALQAAAQRALENWRTQNPNLDTSPLPLPEREPMMTFNILSDSEKAAAQYGVDVFTGAPGSRLAQGFSGNKALLAERVSNDLAEHFGQSVRVRNGPDSGELEYLNPQTNRWTLVNEATGTLRDIGGAVGPAIPAAFGLLGEVKGGPVGAAAGAAAGEGLRRGIGQMIGVREPSAEDIATGSLLVGGIEGVGSKGGQLLGALPASIRQFFKPEVMDADFATSTLLRANANQALADEISERTGQTFQPFTGQLVDDPLLLSEQQRVRGSQVAGVGQAVNLQEQQNRTALEGFFDVITPQGGADPSVVGAGVQREAAQLSEPITESVRNTISRQVAELEDLTAALPNVADDASGQQIRANLQAQRDSFKATERAAWRDVELAYGLNPDTARSTVNVPIAGELKTTLGRLQAEANEALDPAIARGKQQLLGRRLNPALPELTDDELSMVSGIGDLTVEGAVDLHQMQVLLQFLRKRARIASLGTVADDPATRDIRRLESALVAQRNAYLSETNPQLLLQIQEAEALTTVRARTFDQGLTGEILARGAGSRYAIQNSDVVSRTIASRNPEAIRHMVAVMSRNPAGLPTLQEAMLAYYRNEAAPDGIPTRALHDRFVRQNEEAIDAIFGQEASRVRRLGEFSRVVEANVKRLENFEKAVAKRFEGRIRGVAPERVVEAVFNTQFSAKDTRELMALADAAGISHMYRQAVGDQMRRRFVVTGSGIRREALERFVGDEREKLASIMGPQYVSDMEKLLEAARISVRRSNANVPSRSGPEVAINMLARPTIAPPLSARGRGLTSILNFRERARERAWAAIVSDPQTLHAVVLRSNMDARSKEVAELFGAIGASGVIMQMAATEGQ